MAMLLLALGAWMVVRVVHALADAEPLGTDDQAAMVGAAGVEPTAP